MKAMGCENYLNEYIQNGDEESDTAAVDAAAAAAEASAQEEEPAAEQETEEVKKTKGKSRKSHSGGVPTGAKLKGKRPKKYHISESEERNY